MPNGTPSWEWINIKGNKMEQQDWDYQENRFLSYILNGENKDGERFDDDFLVMTSGNPDGSMEVTLPRPPHSGNWQLVFDTSKPASYQETKRYTQGKIYTLSPHSLAVFTAKREDEEKNKELSNLILGLKFHKNR